MLIKTEVGWRTVRVPDAAFREASRRAPGGTRAEQVAIADEIVDARRAEEFARNRPADNVGEVQEWPASAGEFTGLGA